MKYLLILLGFFYVTYAQGQLNIQFAYGIEPLVTSRVLTVKSESISGFQTNSKDYTIKRDKSDKVKFGIKINAYIYIQTSDRLQFYTGIAYLRQPIDQSKFMPSYVYYNGSEEIFIYDIYDYKARFDYLSLPLGVYMSLLKRNNNKIGFDCAGTLNYLLSTTNRDMLDHTISKTENKSFNIGIKLGLFYESLINENFSLHIEPSFNAALTSTLVELASVRQNNYYFGLQIGISHKINAR